MVVEKTPLQIEKEKRYLATIQKLGLQPSQVQQGYVTQTVAVQEAQKTSAPTTTETQPAKTPVQQFEELTPSPFREYIYRESVTPAVKVITAPASTSRIIGPAERFKFSLSASGPLKGETNIPESEILTGQTIMKPLSIQAKSTIPYNIVIENEAPPPKTMFQKEAEEYMKSIPPSEKSARAFLFTLPAAVTLSPTILGVSYPATLMESLKIAGAAMTLTPLTIATHKAMMTRSVEPLVRYGESFTTPESLGSITATMAVGGLSLAKWKFSKPQVSFLESTWKIEPSSEVSYRPSVYQPLESSSYRTSGVASLTFMGKTEKPLVYESLTKLQQVTKHGYLGKTVTLAWEGKSKGWYWEPEPKGISIAKSKIMSGEKPISKDISMFAGGESLYVDMAGKGTRIIEILQGGKISDYKYWSEGYSREFIQQFKLTQSVPKLSELSAIGIKTEFTPLSKLTKLGGITSFISEESLNPQEFMPSLGAVSKTALSPKDVTSLSVKISLFKPLSDMVASLKAATKPEITGMMGMVTAKFQDFFGIQKKEDDRISVTSAQIVIQKKEDDRISVTSAQIGIQKKEDDRISVTSAAITGSAQSKLAQATKQKQIQIVAPAARVSQTYKKEIGSMIAIFPGTKAYQSTPIVPKYTWSPPVVPTFEWGKPQKNKKLTPKRWKEPKQQKKYTPSVIGVVSGKFIAREPRKILTGMEIRYPIFRPLSLPKKKLKLSL